MPVGNVPYTDEQRRRKHRFPFLAALARAYYRYTFESFSSAVVAALLSPLNHFAEIESRAEPLNARLPDGAASSRFNAARTLVENRLDKVLRKIVGDDSHA